MPPLPRTNHRVRSGDVELHVVEVGERTRPPLLLVHGFPDTHEMYAPLLDDLGRDFHVATFDLRGVGASSAPRSAAGFRIDAVLPDFTAVIDAVFGASASVHLLAHDWGSVLAFSYVTDPKTRPRVRSFTSVSGPHLGLMWSENLKRMGSLEPQKMLQGFEQLLRSSYALFFQLPVLPLWLLQTYGEKILHRSLVQGGVSRHDPSLHLTRDDVLARVQHAIQLYSQNALSPPKAPARGSIDVPLSLVIPLRDPFLRPFLYDSLHEYATDLTVHRIDASHWLPRSHPGELARIVRTLAIRVDGASAQRAN